jgi:hypothetical protein
VNFTTDELLASIAVSIASQLANHLIFLSSIGIDFLSASVIKSGKHSSRDVNLIQGL